jgi:hypothetical protein
MMATGIIQKMKKFLVHHLFLISATPIAYLRKKTDEVRAPIYSSFDQKILEGISSAADSRVDIIAHSAIMIIIRVK